MGLYNVDTMFRQSAIEFTNSLQALSELPSLAQVLALPGAVGQLVPLGPAACGPLAPPGEPESGPVGPGRGLSATYPGHSSIPGQGKSDSQKAPG